MDKALYMALNGYIQGLHDNKNIATGITAGVFIYSALYDLYHGEYSLWLTDEEHKLLREIIDEAGKTCVIPMQYNYILAENNSHSIVTINTGSSNLRYTHNCYRTTPSGIRIASI